MITDEQKLEVANEYYKRGILREEVRSYEVSLWTLQDEFITVLKWSNAEQKGRIEDPEMTLDVDGTEEFHFSIPMYIRRRIDNTRESYSEQPTLVLEENPIWYNTRNGNLMIATRKIKVIFNKLTDDEKVFEFVINKITEDHDSGILTCKVECTGLAFYELGKIGYKYTLSADEYYVYYDKKVSEGQTPSLNNINFWAEQKWRENDFGEEAPVLVLYGSEPVNPSTWYYKVQMDWSSFGQTSNIVRDSSVIYEEEFVSSWRLPESGNELKLLPGQVEACREKARMVEIEESNLYNITQTIAETFGVHCRYEYGHDQNYHIISRVVVFYNNFFNENAEGINSITYPYDANRVSREMDAENIITKMFVRSVEDSSTLEGSINIMNTDVNKMKEDYLLNFDWMRANGSITEEQYDAIAEYETKILALNKQMTEKQERLSALIQDIPIREAKIKYYEDSQTYDNEQINLYQAKKDALDLIDKERDGVITISQAAPRPKVLNVQSKTDDKTTYYINLGDQDKGIDISTLHIYRTWSASAQKCYGEFINYVPEYDKNTKLLTRITDFEYPNPHFNESEIDEGGTSYAISANTSVPPAHGWTSSAPTATTEAPYIWVNEYVIYKNGYTHNYYNAHYGLEDMQYADRHVTEIKQLYYYTKSDSAPTAPVGEVSVTSTTSKNTWTLGIPKYTAGYKCYTCTQTKWKSVIIHDTSNNGSIKSTREFVEEPVLFSTPVIDEAYDLQPTSAYVYVTYSYDPDTYYNELIDKWQKKFNADKTHAEKETTWCETEKAEQQSLEEEIKQDRSDKEKLIRAFERMMGPALREGYWEPTDYEDYTDLYEKDLQILTSVPNTDITTVSNVSAIFDWDDEIFEDEQTAYWEEGVELTKKYYFCINLKELFGSTAEAVNAISSYLENANGNFAFIFSDNNQAISANSPDNLTTSGDRLAKYIRVYSVGADAFLGFAKNGNSNTVIPVLVVTGIKELSDTSIDNLKLSTWTNRKGSYPAIGLYSYEEIDGNTVVTLDEGISINSDINKHSLNDVLLSNPTLVYPRIRITSPFLKTGENDIHLYYNGNQLENYKDYKVVSRTSRNGLRDGNNVDVNNVTYTLETCITIVPEVLYKNGDFFNKNIKINYLLSNAGTAVYLDAEKVLKENSEPKASYEVDVALFKKDFISTLYNKRASIVMINDHELKFKNVFGYISHLDLDLDHPENDKIEVKNYKTKFEDLFSNIVAQTEEMKRSGNALDAISAGDIELSTQSFEATLLTQGDILQAYLDSHFDTSEVVQERLASLFEEAGQILTSASISIDNLHALNIKNSKILSSFRENIAASLTPHVLYGKDVPTSAREGDLFVQLDDITGEILGRWVGNTNGSYTQVYDGTLSNITGAAMNVNAETGIIEILAGTKIDMKTGGSLYIGANEDINIVGNKAVNIGGSQINIVSGSAVSSSQERGISLIATGAMDQALQIQKIYDTVLKYYDPSKTNGGPAFQTACNSIIRQSESGSDYILNFGDGIIYRVSNTLISGINNYQSIYNYLNNKCNITTLIDLKPSRLTLKGSDIVMKAGSSITMVSSDGSSAQTSAMRLSFNDGIILGSGKGISLYSGQDNFIYAESTDTLTAKSGTWASVELTPAHLLFGVSADNNSGAVVELNDTQMVLAVGKSSLIKDVDGTSTGLTGVKITKESIGLATGNGTKRNAVIMNDNGISIGSGQYTVSQEQQLTIDKIDDIRGIAGSYVRISTSGIDIGSMSDLYINTNNFKLQTNSQATDGNNNSIIGNTVLAIGANLHKINSNQGVTANTPISTIQSDDEDDENGIDVRLVLNKNGLYIKGNIYATDGIFKGQIRAYSGIIGSEANNFTIGSDSGSNIAYIYSKKGSLDAYINDYPDNKPDQAEGIYIGTNGISLGQTNVTSSVEPTFRVSANGELIAKKGKIGGWILDPNYLQGENLLFVTGTKQIDENDENSDVYENGIYLTNKPPVDLKVVIGSRSYYAFQIDYKTWREQVEANGGDLEEFDQREKDETIYYIRFTTQPKNAKGKYTVLERDTVASTTYIRKYAPELIMVHPNFTQQELKSATVERTIDGETVTEVLYEYAETYITDDVGTKLSYNGEPIVYDGSNNPNKTDSWYAKMQAAGLATSEYVAETYSAGQGELVKVTDLEIGTPMIQYAPEVTFSVDAVDGYMIVNNGFIGDFDLRPEGLLHGTLEESNLVSCTIDKFPSRYYGSCFYDIEIDSAKGIITLYRINGEPIEIDLGNMQALKANITQQTTNYTPDASGSGNYTDTCNGTCSGSCSKQCGNSCYGGCAATCNDGCKDDCAEHCASSCMIECGVDCDIKCTTTCKDSCSNTCIGGCKGTCKNGCYGDCYATCTTLCQGSCKTTCTGRAGNEIM